MQNFREVRILFTGGGTGGHVFPLVAIARSVRSSMMGQGAGEPTMLFIGPNHFTKEIFAAEGIDTKVLLTGKLRRYFSFETFFDIFKLPIGLLQALWHVYWFMPDIVVAKGGYGSFFPTCAAWFYRIPIIVHESDTVMGLANRMAGGLASQIFFAFPMNASVMKRFGDKARVAGNPMRKALLTGSTQEGKAIFQIGSPKPCVLIQGGSQGAQTINELVLQALPELLAYYEIIHVVGAAHFEAIRSVAFTNTPRDLHGFYHPVAFMDEASLAHAYALAECIVSRAGSGSIFEIAALGKPSILIPLPNSAEDHQKKNAYLYADTGAAIVIEQENMTPHVFVQALNALMQDQAKKERMRQSALAFAKPDAADEIASAIFQLIN